MKRATNDLITALSLGCCLELVVACSEQRASEGNLGSETHWLTLCDSDRECGGAFTCECGVCSTSCSRDDQCTEPGARCSHAEEPAIHALCAGVGASAAGICLPSCDANCAPEQSCLEGACVPNDALPPDLGSSSVETNPDASIPGMRDAGSRPDGVNAKDAASPLDSGPNSDAGVDGGSPGVVVLRAVVAEVFPDGTESIAAEWRNGTNAPIFLRGCATADGSYFDGTEWQLYGAFATCAMETPMVEVPAGETYLDLVAGAVPDRGTNRWRLSGPYGVGCRPAGALLGEAECDVVVELVSTNELSWNP